MACSCCWPHPAILGVLSLLCAAAGITLLIITPNVVAMVIHSQLALTSDKSTLFPPFQNPTNPSSGPKMELKLSIYGFDCTNAQDVIAKGSKPVLLQVGPFEYDVSRYKPRDNITWIDDERQISYLYHTEFFHEDGTHDNLINHTFINAGLSGVLVRLIDPNCDSIRDTVNNWIINYDGSTPNDGLFTSRTMKEMLFGYFSPVLHSAYVLHEAMPFMLPDVPTYYPKVIVNDTSITWNGTFTIQGTGKDDISDLLQVKQWANYSTMPWWGSDLASKFRGTDGTQFDLELNVGDTQYAFIDIVGRVIGLKVTESATSNDIPVKRLRIDPQSLKNASENPDNTGYYQFGPSGVWNLTAYPLAPIYNAPIYASKPFFLDADPSYQDSVVFVGPSASRDKHDLEIEVVEHLGVPLRAKIRVQISVLLFPLDGVKVTQNVTETLVPLMWLELSEEPSQDMIDFLKSKLLVRTIGLVGGYVAGALLLLLGVVLALLAIVSYIRRRARAQEAQMLLEINSKKPTGYQGYQKLP